MVRLPYPPRLIKQQLVLRGDPARVYGAGTLYCET